MLSWWLSQADDASRLAVVCGSWRLSLCPSRNDSFVPISAIKEAANRNGYLSRQNYTRPECDISTLSLSRRHCPAGTLASFFCCQCHSRCAHEQAAEIGGCGSNEARQHPGAGILPKASPKYLRRLCHHSWSNPAQTPVKLVA